jgi:hypothetical protein
MNFMYFEALKRPKQEKEAGLMFVIEVSRREQLSGTWERGKQELSSQLLSCNGFVIIRGAIPDLLLTQLQSSFSEIIEDCLASTSLRDRRNIPWRSAQGNYFWVSEGRLRTFIRLAGAFADKQLIANFFSTSVIKSILGEGFYCNTVSSDVCLPDSKLQSPHRDIGFYKGGITRGVLVNVALCHIDERNGATELWPGGSHLWGKESFDRANMRAFDQDIANPKIEEFASYFPSVRPELYPGDLLLRDPGVLHRGTPNQSGLPRPLLTIGYFRAGEVYPFGDPKYSLDPELFNALPDEVKDLVRVRYESGLSYKTI